MPAPSDVSRYADLAGEAFDLLDRLAGLFTDAGRARRLRRQAARLEHRSQRVAASAARADSTIRRERLSRKSADLHRRATLAWSEAQALHPISVESAVLADARDPGAAGS